MNELSPIKPLPQATSTRGNLLPSKTLEGKKPPLDPTQAANTPAVTQNTPPPTAPQQQLETAVDTMNHFVQNVKRDLQFSVDQELDQTVIKVVDSSTGKLIRQIPDDIFLELARKVKETGEMNLLHATG